MITTRSFAVLGALLAFGLTVFGFLVIRAVKQGREFDRYLTVRGAAECEVKATLAIWPLRFGVAAEDLPTLRTSMESARSIVLTYLHARGLAEAEISFGLPEVSDRHDNDYQSKPEVKLPRYREAVTLVVRSKQVEVVKTAIQQADQLLSLGVSLTHNGYREGTEFLFDGLNEVKPGLIAEATANARISAEKFAHDSQARVGSIRHATQGMLEIEDRDAASPEIKRLRVVTTVEFFLQ